MMKYKDKEMQMEHCCSTMNHYLSLKNNRFYYSPLMREYAIDNKNAITIRLLNYCPWCGAKLPASLRDEYFSVLEKEYGLDLCLSDVWERSPLIPPEFLSDEWWRKRGL
jgi:hypothetical protein